ncbi:competence/damage-inducible protein A [Desulfolucanica intricata]|uniref:competence/damage-inducible protein A n=1 Tax=Desulfolucanica intricata TaxID=1285191 RepID=UPI000829E95E|nr:competence/damage-inducible protein A [Desulfolucanica intricata]
MRAEIIFTGTELLIGQVLNTHAQFLGRQLSQMGIEVTLHTTVGDCWKKMAEVFRQGLERSDLIITTGGLGPTTDDLTKETIAEVLGLPMLLDNEVLENMRTYFIKRGMTMPESITKQAYFPQGSRVLTNPVGTAPGVLLEYNEKIIINLPGPPFELIPTFETSVIPYLSELSGRGKITRFRSFKLTGIAESVVQDHLKDLCRQENPNIAFLAKPGEVYVRITAKANNPEETDTIVNEMAEKVRSRLGEYIFAVNEEVIEEVVGNLLAEKGLTIALAESCTGGLITARLTNVPGSSRYLLGGIVAYNNNVKEKLLGVPGYILKNNGAVSRQTAVAMAQGVCKIMDSNFGLAVTGIAGPGGGTPEKPQGLVYIALTTPDGTCCRKFYFPGERSAVRQGTVNAALNMVRTNLLA